MTKRVPPLHACPHCAATFRSWRPGDYCARCRNLAVLAHIRMMAPSDANDNPTTTPHQASTLTAQNT